MIMQAPRLIILLCNCPLYDCLSYYIISNIFIIMAIFIILQILLYFKALTRINESTNASVNRKLMAFDFGYSVNRFFIHSLEFRQNNLYIFEQNYLKDVFICVLFIFSENKQFILINITFCLLSIIHTQLSQDHPSSSSRRINGCIFFLDLTHPTKLPSHQYPLNILVKNYQKNGEKYEYIFLYININVINRFKTSFQNHIVLFLRLCLIICMLKSNEE